jgi:hypothetical protein
MNLAAGISSFPSAWNACHGAFYQVRDCEIAWNTKAQPWLHYEETSLGPWKILWAEATPAGVGEGISAHCLWVSLWGSFSEGAEAEILEQLKRFAKARGKTRVVIGGEDFHFLPGIPLNETAGRSLADACSRTGARLFLCSDYVGDLAAQPAVQYVEAAVSAAQSTGLSLQRVESQAQKQALADFLQKEFPGRWAREWGFWAKIPASGCARWFLLEREHGKVLGFSRLGLRAWGGEGANVWTPGGLRLPLAADASWRPTDACLGPLGVAASARGQGAGRCLLGLSLAILTEAGGASACIDWTDAHGFYAPLAWQEARKYASVRWDF